VAQVGQQEKTRSRESIARTGISKVYPFAAAGINVTRVVAQVFGLVGPAGNKTPFEGVAKKYWPLADELNELYCVVFKLMDKVSAMREREEPRSPVEKARESIRVVYETKDSPLQRFGAGSQPAPSPPFHPPACPIVSACLLPPPGVGGDGRGLHAVQRRDG
jgi:hypothetical protein